MFLPIPFFWALNEQTGTAALFMARKMDGYVGFYTILPDQFGFIDSIVYLALIPVFQYVVYPPLTRCGLLRGSLRKITAAGVFMALSFVIYGCLSLVLEATYPVLPNVGEGQIRIYNTLPCHVYVSAEELNDSGSVFIAQGSYFKKTDLRVNGSLSIPYSIVSSCSNTSSYFEVNERETVGYYFNASNEEAVSFVDNIEKHSRGYPFVRQVFTLHLFR